MRHGRLAIACLAASLAIAAPALARRAPAEPRHQRGIASFYAHWHEGRLTANGEHFHALGLSAASRSWPLGSWIRVCTIAHRRCVVLWVNDRGPYHPPRILDVSLGAARRLGFEHAGTAEVEITAAGS